MAMQATGIDGVASVFDNTTALLVAIVAAAVLYLWLDPALPFSDAGIPWRQLLHNRSVAGIVTCCRHFYTIVRCRTGWPAQPGTSGRDEGIVKSRGV